MAHDESGWSPHTTEEHGTSSGERSEEGGIRTKVTGSSIGSSMIKEHGHEKDAGGTTDSDGVMFPPPTDRMLCCQAFVGRRSGG